MKHRLIKQLLTIAITLPIIFTAFPVSLAEAAASNKIAFAKAFGANFDDKVLDVDTGGGLVASVGYTQATVDFDRDAVNSDDTYVTSGLYDPFVVVYNTSGVFQWLKAMGGAQMEIAYGVDVDDAGNVYVTGYFTSSTVDFDPDNVTAGDTATNVGGDDMFLVMYDNTGAFQWLKVIAGSSAESGVAVIANDFGDVYVTGTFSSSNVDFDTANVVSGDTLSASGTDSFLAKYSSSGVLQWVKKIDVTAKDMTLDGGENVLLTGSTLGASVDFDENNVVAGDTVVASPGMGFFAKYNPAGVLQFVKDVAVVGTDIASDGSSNIFWAGSSGSTDFDPDNVVAGDTVTSSNAGDAFVAKYNNTGVLQWVKAVGGVSTENATGVSVDASGDVIVTGNFTSAVIDFDEQNSVLGDTQYLQYPNSGFPDIFMAKYSSAGVIQWLKIVGGAKQDDATAVAVDQSNDAIYLGGWSTADTNSPVDFDWEYVVAGDTKTDLANIDGFVARYNSPSGSAIPVYRFWSNSLQGHFYTLSANEKGYVQQNYATVWQFEGPMFYAYPTDDCTGRSEVYRFWSDVLQGHFYTISASERDYVQATYPTIWSYEGPVYCAYTASEPGASAVHRFWSDSLQGHFYTISSTEKDYVIANYANVWTYEGIVFYAVP